MNKEKYFVKGMHCSSCEIYIESQFKGIKGIKNVKSDSKTQTLTFDISEKLDKEEIIEKINSEIKENGYEIQTELDKKTNNTNQLGIASFLAFLIILIFLGIQKFTLGENLFAQELTLPIVFLLGIFASISSCMAVVGSLVLSMSSVYAKEGEGIKPMMIFHASRLISFFILGGVLGFVGSLFLLSKSVEIVMGTVLFLMMFFLGLNLLNVNPWFKKFEFTLPKGITQKALEKNKFKSIFAPVLLGIITFFLPCGFTQAMQLNAVFTGDIFTSAMIMFVFALGTLPVLLIITLSSKRITQGKNSDLFLKTAGFLVIFFAIYNLIGTLIANGVISPIF